MLLSFLLYFNFSDPAAAAVQALGAATDDIKSPGSTDVAHPVVRTVDLVVLLQANGWYNEVVVTV